MIWLKIDDTVVLEIIRQAELQLSAQLSVAIAADQRAVTLSGTMATLSTASIGIGLAGLTAQEPNYVLFFAGISSGILLAIGLFYAILTARPVGFNFVGNQPKSWSSWEDLYKPLRKTLWEQSKHYQRMIDENALIMEENGKLLRRAMLYIILSPLGGLVAGIVTFFSN